MLRIGPCDSAGPDANGNRRAVLYGRHVAASRGRAPDRMRTVTIDRGFTRHAEGSVLVAFGDTRVLCTASRRTCRSSCAAGRSWITRRYGMLPRDHTRGDREARSRQKGRAHALEIQRLIVCVQLALLRDWTASNFIAGGSASHAEPILTFVAATCAAFGTSLFFARRRASRPVRNASRPGDQVFGDQAYGDSKANIAAAIDGSDASPRSSLPCCRRRRSRDDAPALAACANAVRFRILARAPRKRRGFGYDPPSSRMRLGPPTSTTTKTR